MARQTVDPAKRALALILGVYYAYVAAVPVYTANSSVALESRQEQVMDIQSVVTGLGGDQSTINTETEVIRSRGLVEQLVLDMNLLEDPNLTPACVRRKNFPSAGLLRL